MRRFRTITLVALGLAAGPIVSLRPTDLAAQGIPRGARLRNTAATNVPRLMVATPTVNAAADSASSVAVGGGLRKRMEKVVGSDYSVVSDSIMNEALTQYGYPRNAILSPALNVTLAKQIPNTRVVITTTMAKAGNQYAATSRLVGVADEAGYVVQLKQDGSQPPAEFGAKIAEALEPGVKAVTDAHGCMEQRAAGKLDKANEAAQKALKTNPNYALAHYCLALIALDQKKPAGEVEKELNAAAKGDNLSLPVYLKLAEIYQSQKDTARTVAVFGDLLRVAPTNQKLREDIFKFLLQANRPDVAKAVADSGLKLDPYNADLYDLKSNACAFLGDFKCAVEALNQAYQVDSTRADSLFLAKAVAFSEQRMADTNPKPTRDDSTSYINWVRRSAAKFPNSPAAIQGMLRVYGMTGQADSLRNTARKLLAVDTTSAVPAVIAIQSLAASKQLDSARAAEFLPIIQKRAEPALKDQTAAIYLASAAPFLAKDSVKNVPADYARAASFLRVASGLASPNSRVSAQSNFFLGFATFQQAAERDADVAKSKSCDGAKQQQALLQESRAALAKGQAFNPDNTTKLMGALDQFDKRVNSMVKSYCK